MHSQSIDAVDLVVIDVETTGLEPLQGDRICEIGAIKWHGGEEIGRFHSMVNPGRSISPAAAEVNRIIALSIRGAMADMYGEQVAQSVRVQYGGSVKPDNMGDFAVQSEIDGALVGGDSLKADSFLGIIKAASGQARRHHMRPEKWK